jgi:hypothetical protein
MCRVGNRGNRGEAEICRGDLDLTTLLNKPNIVLN